MTAIAIIGGFTIALFGAANGYAGNAMISVISVTVFGVGLMITGAVFQAKNEIVAAIAKATAPATT